MSTLLYFRIDDMYKCTFCVCVCMCVCLSVWSDVWVYESVCVYLCVKCTLVVVFGYHNSPGLWPSHLAFVPSGNQWQAKISLLSRWINDQQWPTCTRASVLVRIWSQEEVLPRQYLFYEAKFVAGPSGTKHFFHLPHMGFDSCAVSTLKWPCTRCI